MKSECSPSKKAQYGLNPTRTHHTKISLASSPSLFCFFLHDLLPVFNSKNWQNNKKMSISLELPLFKTSHSVSLLPYNATSSFSSGKKIKCKRKWKPPYYCSSSSSSSRIRVTMNENDESCPPSVCENENDSNNKFVQVIAIGSRKDALLDFCLDSPLNSSSSLQFWYCKLHFIYTNCYFFFLFLLIIIVAIVVLCRNIVTDGSPNVQLQERFLGKGILSGLECWTKALCFFFFFGVVYVELVCNYMMLFPFNFCRFNSKNCGSSIVHTDMFEGYYPCLYIP